MHDIELMSEARLLQIVSGSAPVADERFCIGRLLVQKSPTERIQLALAAKLSWTQFSRRFESLTGISRERTLTR